MDQAYQNTMLKILSWSCFISGAMTLLPSPFTQELSILGYKSICPFAPISTVLTLYAGTLIHHFHKNGAGS